MRQGRLIGNIEQLWVSQLWAMKRSTIEGHRKASRVGISDVCPEKDFFHDPRDVMLTSQMAISEPYHYCY